VDEGIRIATLHQLRSLVRGMRLEQGLSQESLAERAGVSRKWISEFERGNPNAQLGLVLAVLDALQLRLTAHPVLAESTGPEADPIEAFLNRSTGVAGLK
jgi:HTH-type transcriptional regulator / antitoxin HipB